MYKVRFGRLPLYKGETFLVSDRVTKNIRVKNPKRTRKNPKKYITKNVGRYQLLLSGERLWINEDEVKLVTSQECKVLQKPAVVDNQIILYKNPARKTPRVAPKQVYTPISYLKRTKTNYYRVYFENKYYLVDAEQFKFKFNQDDLKKVKGGLFAIFGYHLEFSAGAVAAYNQGDYEDMITDIPDVLDVSQLQDPILTSVDSGSGFNLSGILSWPTNYKTTHRLEISYSQVKYKFSGLENPNTSSTAYSELNDSTSKTLDLKYLEIAYHWNQNHWLSTKSHMYYGIGAKLKYLFDPASVTVKADCETASCTFGKRDDIDIESGASQTEVMISLVGGYGINRWRFWGEVDSELKVFVKSSYEIF